MIYIGSDHAGFNLKEELKKNLDELGYEYEDLGNRVFDPQDDYPDFAFKVAQKVVGTNGEGILICATGVGVCLAANKVKGIRAAACYDEFTVLHSREHNNANILCLGAKVTDLEKAKKIVRVWLGAKFAGEEKHRRRLEKIEKMEEG